MMFISYEHCSFCMGGNHPAASAALAVFFDHFNTTKRLHNVCDLTATHLRDFTDLGVGERSVLEGGENLMLGVFATRAIINLVGESCTELVTGLAIESMVATSICGASGFEQVFARDQAGENFAGAIQRSLADAGGLSGADLPIEGEVMQNEKIIHDEVGMSA